MRTDLPTGTVTFLFTDVEGSTRLLHDLGAEAYAQALDDHRRVLRAASAARGGVEVDTQGDALFVAFPTAGGAVDAAGQAQRELADGPIAVRMGIHSGAPHLAPEGYVGEDVHLGARVASAGHGGQVLLSAAARGLVDVEVTDLGKHRLKDFDEPVAIYQLGDEPFPPLKTISNTNLPRPVSSFLGRERERSEVVALVRDGARLVTLTGPGGTGKTRLSIEAAAELVGSFTGGVFWVGLATVRDPALVSDAIAQTLGAPGDLAAHIGDRELLLLLDNFEQVVDAAPDLSALLQACPNLCLMVTSREVLRIQGEVEYAVPPLAESEAVELFCVRANVEPDEDVAELCRRLDSLPLAVELAAARSAVLSPSQVLERLGHRLDLLKGGRDADPRQQTLRATIEWSHELLSDEEQRLFAALAVFDGGGTLEAIEEVTGADLDTLQSLVDKSLVRHTGERFWLLETIRDFALERLAASADADVLLRAHAEHFLALGEQANLISENAGRVRPELVRPELENFRRAIDWAAEHDLELAYRLVISLEESWVVVDPFEGARRTAALLTRGEDVSPRLRARCLRVYSETAFMAGDYERSRPPLDESLEIFRALGDERAVAVGLHRVAVGALVAGDVTRAQELLEESLAICRRIPNPKLLGDILINLGWIERGKGDLETALELLEKGTAMLEEVGFTWLRASALGDIAVLYHELGQIDVAGERARRSLRLCRELGDRRTTVFTLALLARFAAEEGRNADAGRLWGAIEAEEKRGPIGNWEIRRDAYAATIVLHGDPEFDAARSAGRRLSLAEIAEWALEPA